MAFASLSIDDRLTGSNIQDIAFYFLYSPFTYLIRLCLMDGLWSAAHKKNGERRSRVGTLLNLVRLILLAAYGVELVLSLRPGANLSIYDQIAKSVVILAMVGGLHLLLQARKAKDALKVYLIGAALFCAASIAIGSRTGTTYASLWMSSLLILPLFSSLEKIGVEGGYFGRPLLNAGRCCLILAPLFLWVLVAIREIRITFRDDGVKRCTTPIGIVPLSAIRTTPESAIELRKLAAALEGKVYVAEIRASIAYLFNETKPSIRTAFFGNHQPRNIRRFLEWMDAGKRYPQAIVARRHDPAIRNSDVRPFEDWALGTREYLRFLDCIRGPNTLSTRNYLVTEVVSAKIMLCIDQFTKN